MNLLPFEQASSEKQIDSEDEIEPKEDTKTEPFINLRKATLTRARNLSFVDVTVDDKEDVSEDDDISEVSRDSQEEKQTFFVGPDSKNDDDQEMTLLAGKETLEP